MRTSSKSNSSLMVRRLVRAVSQKKYLIATTWRATSTRSIKCKRRSLFCNTSVSKRIPIEDCELCLGKMKIKQNQDHRAKDLKAFALSCLLLYMPVIIPRGYWASLDLVFEEVIHPGIIPEAIEAVLDMDLGGADPSVRFPFRHLQSVLLSNLACSTIGSSVLPSDAVPPIFLRISQIKFSRFLPFNIYILIYNASYL